MLERIVVKRHIQDLVISKYERICLFASRIFEKHICIFEKRLCRIYEIVFKRKYDKIRLQKRISLLDCCLQILCFLQPLSVV